MKLADRTREAIGDGEGISPRAYPEAYLQRTWMLLLSKSAPTGDACRLYPGAICHIQTSGGYPRRPAELRVDRGVLLV